MNIAPVVRGAVIIYQLVLLLLAMTVIYAQSAISIFVTIALAMASVNCYGERRCTDEGYEF